MSKSMPWHVFCLVLLFWRLHVTNNQRTTLVLATAEQRQPRGGNVKTDNKNSVGQSPVAHVKKNVPLTRSPLIVPEAPETQLKGFN